MFYSYSYTYIYIIYIMYGGTPAFQCLLLSSEFTNIIPQDSFALGTLLVLCIKKNIVLVACVGYFSKNTSWISWMCQFLVYGPSISTSWTDAALLLLGIGGFRTKHGSASYMKWAFTMRTAHLSGRVA